MAHGTTAAKQGTPSSPQRKSIDPFSTDPQSLRRRCTPSPPRRTPPPCRRLTGHASILIHTVRLPPPLPEACLLGSSTPLVAGRLPPPGLLLGDVAGDGSEEEDKCIAAEEERKRQQQLRRQRHEMLPSPDRGRQPARSSILQSAVPPSLPRQLRAA